MTNDDKLFQYILGRLQNRESASTTLTIIASSASLVFLSIILTKDSIQLFPYVVIGILFPTIGIIYNELTYRGIHTNDHYKIQKLIEKQYPDYKKITDDDTHRKKRIFLMRLIFFMPIFAWLYVLENMVILVVAYPLLIGIIMLIVCTDPKNSCPDKKHK